MGLGKSESAENQQIHMPLAFAGKDPLLAFWEDQAAAWMLPANIGIYAENLIFCCFL